MEEYILMFKLDIKKKDSTEIEEELKQIRDLLTDGNIQFKEKAIEEWTGYIKARTYEPFIGIYVRKEDQKKAEELINQLGNKEYIVENHTELKEVEETEEDSELTKSINTRNKINKVMLFGWAVFCIVMIILTIIVNSKNN